MGQTINEKGIAVDALSRYELQTSYRSDVFPPLKALHSGFPPVEETDQFGFQDPPSLSRLGGLYATVADVLEECGLGNPQVLAGFLSR